jgi:hypothetical protein
VAILWSKQLGYRSTSPLCIVLYQACQGRRLLLIEPCELAAMKWDLLESQVIHEPSEMTHHCPVVVRIIFILYLIYKLKSPANIQGPMQVPLISRGSCRNRIFSLFPCCPYSQESHHALPFSGQN